MVLAKWKIKLLKLNNSDTVRNDTGIETPSSPELSSACVSDPDDDEGTEGTEASGKLLTPLSFLLRAVSVGARPDG